MACSVRSRDMSLIVPEIELLQLQETRKNVYLIEASTRFWF